MLPRAQNHWSLEEAAHLLRRAGFGGSPEEIGKFHALGRETAVESLLEPDEPVDAFPLPEWADRESVARAIRESFAQRRALQREMRGLSAEEREKARRARQQEERRRSRDQGLEARGWWFGRMLESRAPLREKMVLFWHDHFATSVQKVRQPGLMLIQNALFRDHATGDFKALTHAILRDPAMMLYLDTQRSTKRSPNENFAREVMELFTLGEGNYTEQDVKEAARAFTGYTLDRVSGGVSHQKRQWDEGTKTVLGKTGRFDGDGVIDVIFGHDAAARYLPSKLWQYFVEDEVPREVSERLAEVFRDSHFAVAPVLREIFLSKVFYDPSVRRQQIKSPIQFLVQMCRELELDGLPPGYPLVAQQQLGQILFLPPNVAGWDWGKGWINTNTLLSRYNIAGIVTKGSVDTGRDGNGAGDMMMPDEGGPGMAMVARRVNRTLRSWPGPDYGKIAPPGLRGTPADLVRELEKRFFQADVGARVRESFVGYAEAKSGGDFTDREIAELCHLMMSTPQYQLV